MALPSPWNQFEASLENLQDFGLGAQRLADFFKGKEEKHAPDELLEMLLGSKPTFKWMERFLFSLFDIGVSDKQIGTRALELHRLRRMWLRVGAGSELSEEEVRLAELVGPFFAMEAGARERAVLTAREVFGRLLQGAEISSEEREGLATLVRAEAEALRDRVNWLSENTDPYNMKTMARVLPRLRMYDEAVAEGLELAGKLEKSQPIGSKVLSFEMYMKGAFDKWCKKIAMPAPLRQLAALVEQQRGNKIPTLDLVALSTLCRWTFEVAEERTGPLDWVAKAFKSYREGEFEVDAGQAAPILASALASSGVKAKGSRLIGHFGKKLYPALVGRDLLTKPVLKAADEGMLDLKMVLAQNMTRDGVIEALLNNPKVYQAPGMVAFIVANSRSIAILSKIAKSRALHSGFANRDVPLELLRSPCNIPISLLRPMINVRNVTALELKHIVRSKTGVRREVRGEVETYLKSRG